MRIFIYNCMENVYYLERTRNSPEIYIDYDNKTVRMVGRCIMEDSHIFFVDLLQKLVDIDNLKFILELEYLNSSSLKHLIALLRSELSVNDVEWYYSEEDFDIEEKGKDIKEIVEEHHPNIKFILIKKPR